MLIRCDYALMSAMYFKHYLTFQKVDFHFTIIVCKELNGRIKPEEKVVEAMETIGLASVVIVKGALPQNVETCEDTCARSY